jgi:hypothetical protein
MDEGRTREILQVFDHIFIRLGLRTLQFLLGLTVCGLYAARSRNGSGRCSFAVLVGSLSVLTVIGSIIIRFFNGHRTVFFIWEAILL